MTIRRPIKEEDRAKIHGDYPYYGASGIIDYVNDYIFNEELVLLGEDGENILSRNTRLAFRISGRTWVNNHAHVMRPIPNIVDIGFLSECLESISYIKYNTGTAQPKLPKSVIEAIDILLPPLEEQRKIAEILSTWDEAIALTEALIAALGRRKQALMQVLLTGEVRFQEFEGEWEIKQLSDFLMPKLRKVQKPSSSYLALGIRSHGKGTFTRTVDDPETVEMDELYEVRTGDLIVNITFAWEGAIALVGQQDEGKLVSHRFPTYEFKRDQVVSEFFKYLMITHEFFFRLGLISPGGAGRNRVLSKKDFLALSISAPSVDEQKKIGEVLGTTDEQIQLLSNYDEALKAQKRGLMQQLLTGAVRV